MQAISCAKRSATAAGWAAGRQRLHAGALAHKTQALRAIGIEPELEVVGSKIDAVLVEKGGCVAGAKVVLHTPNRGCQVVTWVAEPTVRHVEHACKHAVCEHEV